MTDSQKEQKYEEPVNEDDEALKALESALTIFATKIQEQSSMISILMDSVSALQNTNEVVIKKIKEIEKALDGAFVTDDDSDDGEVMVKEDTHVDTHIDPEIKE